MKEIWKKAADNQKGDTLSGARKAGGRNKWFLASVLAGILVLLWGAVWYWSRQGLGTEPEGGEGALDLFARMPDIFYFSSGAGGWATELYLEDEGSFSGLFHSWESGEKYPGGTFYLCEFSGRFSAPEQKGEFLCSLRVESLEYDPPGKVEIEDRTRYITAGPLGLEDVEEMLVFLPGYPTEDLPEAVFDWIRGAREFWDGARPEKLPFYVLYNGSTQEAFYSETQQ